MDFLGAPWARPHRPGAVDQTPWASPFGQAPLGQGQAKARPRLLWEPKFSADTVSYPPPITTQDVSNESSYKIGKDFAVNSKTKEQSVSRPRFIQVYRMVTKPTSYRDFDGNLHIEFVF